MENQQQHGKFVRDAMKKTNEAGGQQQQEEKQGEGQSNIKLGRLGKKAKGHAAKEQASSNMGTSQVSDTVVLQTFIQQICQNANPLGKALEFIQDDLESMNHELHQWHKIYDASRARMVDMNKATEDVTTPSPTLSSNSNPSTTKSQKSRSPSRTRSPRSRTSRPRSSRTSTPSTSSSSQSSSRSEPYSPNNHHHPFYSPYQMK